MEKRPKEWEKSEKIGKGKRRERMWGLVKTCGAPLNALCSKIVSALPTTRRHSHASVLVPGHVLFFPPAKSIFHTLVCVKCYCGVWFTLAREWRRVTGSSDTLVWILNVGSISCLPPWSYCNLNALLSQRFNKLEYIFRKKFEKSQIKSKKTILLNRWC